MAKVAIVQWLIFGFVLENFIQAAPLSGKANNLNVAVIGAGPSGLVSAKYALAQGFDVTVYEQNFELGGIWSYTDKIGKNRFGVNIHSPMYKNLRTNSPIQCMEFADHHYPNNTLPYPGQPVVLKFLQSYAERFKLKRHIKFNHIVQRVLPIENDKWEIIVKDLPTNRFMTKIYDAVFVCNGHFSSPRIPSIEGNKEFTGRLVHSHDFRAAEAYRGEKILVIGGGSSGFDMVTLLSNTASRITFSQRAKPNQTAEEREEYQNLFSNIVTIQDEVTRFTRFGAEFADGTQENFTVVLFATGYNYSYPFLSVDTGIHVDEKFIEPLFKQVFNIEHPTMAFIGVPTAASNFLLFDLQARFAMKMISGEKKLPSQKEMLEDMWTQIENHWNKGYRKHYTHYLGPEQKEYYKQLSDLADIENIPDVIAAIHRNSSDCSKEDPLGFRKYKYTIVDDQTFERVKYTD